LISEEAAMTTLSSQAGIDLLLSEPAKYANPEALRNLATRVAIESPGRLTVLYSGPIGGGISSSTLIDGMVLQGENIRVINRTQAAMFLDSTEFTTAVKNAFGLESLDDLNLRNTPANDFLYHPTKGLWADASARFVGGATGDVRIVAPFAVALLLNPLATERGQAALRKIVRRLTQTASPHGAPPAGTPARRLPARAPFIEAKR